jgi:hypothetical protein
MAKKDEFLSKMEAAGLSAVDMVIAYFIGENDEPTPKVEKAFKFLPHAIKMRHMEQVKVSNERSQALRLLKFLPDDETRRKYIGLTQPQVAPLLEHRPGKQK